MSMRICLVTPGILPVPATKGGAIETLAMSLVKQNEIQQRMDLTVTSIADPQAEAIARQYSHTEFRFFKPAAALPDALYHYWQAIFKRIFPHSHLISSLYYRSVLNSIRREHFDVVVFEGGESRGFTAYDKAFHGKLWYHVHANPTDPTESAYFDNVMVLSGFVMKNWRQLCSDKTQNLMVLPNGVNTELFKKALDIDPTQAKARFGYTTDDVVVLYCGRISSEKGVKQLVEAMKLIANANVKLMVIGKADPFPESQRYFEEVKTLARSVTHRITFVGYVPNNQLAEYYAAADMQVIPSQWEEGAGNVCIEGMAAGKPIIASNCGGIPEYVDDDCALLIDRGSAYIDDLAKAIQTLASDRERRIRMSEHGRIRAEAFSERRYYDNYADCIEGVMHNGI
ncbi:glycosyltransferase family 4 protein [Bifidobacterium callimiconis]|uniref:glycosyltransferase family 4 protein n=1 Tax=Bifidobacterium callimiconis TaxID=2306973 RepID=UPI001BDC4908|nr:glycosyltransferase family 4 protein [Bifidobacterium callimiconis]MBT1177298.1 glycosyltransferase family 4 protein [Bifidobacterium callimiconis]